MVRSLKPDLVLMDVNLPGIDGLEATRQILSEDRPVVLVLSTYEAAEYEPRATAAGASAYIQKSDFGPDELIQAWETAQRAIA